MKTAPIVLFTYNRLDHTRATVQALQKNKFSSDSKLIIFSDAPGSEVQTAKVNEIRKFIRTIQGFKDIQIIEREKNYGLGDDIIKGVTQVIDEYEEAIILEDDLITSPYFLQFMNEALQLYKENDKVISVHGYLYPVQPELPETFF